MKRIRFICLLLVIGGIGSAQPHYVDSLHYELGKSRDDTTKVDILDKLTVYYAFNRFDSGIFYAQKTLDLSKKINYPFGLFLGLRGFFFCYNTQGNYTKALEVTLENLKITEKIKNEDTHLRSFLFIIF